MSVQSKVALDRQETHTGQEDDVVLTLQLKLILSLLSASRNTHKTGKVCSFDATVKIDFVAAICLPKHTQDRKSM